MSATLTETVAGYDIGSNGELRISAILRLFQRTAERDLAFFGIYHTKMLEKHLAFVISQINLRIIKPIYEHDTVTVKTYPRSSKGVCFTREYTVYVGGERRIEASSKWPLLDTEKRCAVRPTELDRLGNITPDDSDPFTLPPIRVPNDVSSLTKVDERRVYPSMLDANGHVNNTFFPDFVTDCIFEQMSLSLENRQFVLNFQRELTVGQIFSLYYGVKDGKHIVIGRNDASGETSFSAAITL